MEIRSKYAQIIGYATGVLGVFAKTEQDMPLEEVKKLHEMLNSTLWNRIHDDSIDSSKLFESIS